MSKKNSGTTSNPRWLVWAGLVFLAAAFGLRYAITEFTTGQHQEDVAALLLGLGIVLAGLCWIGYWARNR